MPHTIENLNFINKLNFQFCFLTATEFITHCNLITKYKNRYATHKNDVATIATPFRIRLKPKAQLITQLPSKVSIHYSDKLNALLEELEKHNIIKQICSSPQDKPVYGTTTQTLSLLYLKDTLLSVFRRQTYQLQHRTT